VKQSSAKLKKTLWKVFSIFIRQRDKGECFTCPAKPGWKYGDAGHFIPKSVGGLALYFHEDNVHFQCKRCNMPPLCGNQYVYGKKLGEEKVAELEALKNITTKDYPFEEKIAYYKSFIK
jgi:hypothetical protein